MGDKILLEFSVVLHALLRMKDFSILERSRMAFSVLMNK